MDPFEKFDCETKRSEFIDLKKKPKVKEIFVIIIFLSCKFPDIKIKEERD